MGAWDAGGKRDGGKVVAGKRGGGNRVAGRGKEGGEWRKEGEG
jgi:hypothetical protein